MGGVNAKDDLARYRDGYPDEVLDDPRLTRNVAFYSNALASKPDGDFVDRIHSEWWGDHDRLEIHHGYIQWLFPIHEPGLNYDAQVLQRHEAATIAASPALQQRLVRSYELMLHFYGMELVRDSADAPVAVQRLAGDEAAQRKAYINLNASSHNYLRITRILKCLGECGLESLKKPWLDFLVHEVYVSGALANLENSLKRYWAPALRGEAELAAIRAAIDAAANPPLEEAPDQARAALAFSMDDIGRFIAVWHPGAAATAGGTWREARITDYWGIARKGHLCELRAAAADEENEVWIDFRRQGADDRPPKMLRAIRSATLTGAAARAAVATATLAAAAPPAAAAALPLGALQSPREDGEIDR